MKGKHTDSSSSETNCGLQTTACAPLSQLSFPPHTAYWGLFPSLTSCVKCVCDAAVCTTPLSSAQLLSLLHTRRRPTTNTHLQTGYSDLTLSGEAIDDQVLLNVAAGNGPTLTSLRVLGAPNVTDAGLCTLISAAPNLKSFTIEDAGPGAVGHFMPTLLQHCKQLESLVVDGGEAMNWGALRASGAWAAAMAAAAQAAANAAAGDSSNEDSSSSGGGGGSAHARRGYVAAAAAAASSGTSSASHQQLHSQQHPQQQMQPSLSAHDNGHGVFEAHASSSQRHQLARHTGSITSGSRVLAAAAAAGGASGGSSNSAFAAAAVAAAAGAGASQQHFAQPQQQQGPHAHRLSSSSSSFGGHSTDYSSCPEDDAVDVDSEDVDGGDRADAGNAHDGASSASSSSSGSSSRSLDAASDSTSISMPSQAVEALTQQLQHILSGGGAGGQHQQHQHLFGGQHPPPAAAAGGGGAGANNNNSSNRSQQQQAAGSAPAHASQQQQEQQEQQEQQQQQSSSMSSRRSNSSSAGGAAAAAAKFSHTVLRRLRVRLANTDTLQQLLECVPSLTELSLDGPALSVQAAAVLCPGLRRLSYLVCSPSELDAALVCLGNMRSLRSLELEVKGMVLSTEQLRVSVCLGWCVWGLVCLCGGHGGGRDRKRVVGWGAQQGR